jgi:hypothetical protein
MVYYHTISHSPLAKLIRSAGYDNIDPSLIWFTDSSHGDCDEHRSTGCHVGMIQGGLIDFSSFVPLPIPQSTAESESNALCVGVMAASYARQVYCDIVLMRHDNPRLQR